MHRLSVEKNVSLQGQLYPSAKTFVFHTEQHVYQWKRAVDTYVPLGTFVSPYRVTYMSVEKVHQGHMSLK